MCLLASLEALYLEDGLICRYKYTLASGRQTRVYRAGEAERAKRALHAWRSQERSIARAQEDLAIHLCSSCFDSSSPSPSSTTATSEGERRPGEVFLYAPLGHIWYVSLHCWLKQGDETFGCSQADPLCYVIRGAKITLIALNSQLALTTLVACLQQESSPCGPCFHASRRPANTTHGYPGLSKHWIQR